MFPPKFGGFVERLASDGYFAGFTGKGWGPGNASDENGQSRKITGIAYQKKKAKPPTQQISNNDYSGNFRDFLADAPSNSPWVFWYGTTEPHRAYEFQSGVRMGKKLTDIDRVPGYWPDNETVRHDMLDYAVEVEHFDLHLGKIIAALESAGQLDNTLIVATSDHGMPFPRGKGQAYEESNHIPLAVRWPSGIQGTGRVVDDFVNFTDLAPTFLQAAKIDSPAPIMQPMSGQSLFDIFESSKTGTVNPKRDHVLVGKERHDVGRPNDWGYPIRGILKGTSLYLQNFETQRWPAGNPETGYLNCDGGATKTVVLNGRRSGEDLLHWELCFGKRPSEELYHLDTDQDCLINLATSDSHREEIAKLKKQLEAELTEQGDPRMSGDGGVFDRYPNVARASVNFYDRFMTGEDLNANWVNPTDFETDWILDNVTVVVGDNSSRISNPSPSDLNVPFGIEFDQEGNGVIAEYTGNRVLKLDPKGKLTVIAGGKQGYSGDGGPATEAAFRDLHNLALSKNGDIYLSDHDNNVVRKIDAETGFVSTFAGTGKAGHGGDGEQASAALFHQVMSVTLTPNGSALLVSDLKNRRIRSIDLKTNIVTTISGNGKRGIPENGVMATEAPLFDPRAAAMDSDGNVYILERGGNALRVVRPNGKIETVAGNGKRGNTDGNAESALFNEPKHLAIDARGNVYIADDMNHSIRRYDPSSKTVTTILGQGKFKLNRPHGVTVRGKELYITDSWNHRVLRMPLPF